MRIFRAVRRDGSTTEPTLWRFDWDLPQVAETIERIEVADRPSEWYAWNGSRWELGPGATAPTPKRRRTDRRALRLGTGR